MDFFLCPSIAGKNMNRCKSDERDGFTMFRMIELDNKFFMLAAGIGMLIIVLAWYIGYQMASKTKNRANDAADGLDPLTGLWNRHTFLQHLKNRIEQSGNHQSFTLAVLNVNQFRWLNDVYGTEWGDRIIQIVAQHIRRIIGEHSVIARMYGDEFVFIMEEDLDRSSRIAFDIITYFEETPVTLKGMNIHILVSIGLAGYPQHGNTAGMLLRHADTALSAARYTYSNVTVFEPVMDQNLQDEFRLATDLRFAVKNGELFLVYQPRIDLATGKVAAIEALLRWKHPELGMISPGSFIPIAEKTGAIVPIGLWVLETACRQAVGWNWDGADSCRISINISVQQLRCPNFISDLDDILKRTGLNPKKLELELTESIFIEDTKKISGVLSEIKRRGIRIAIDDFGKGYSSLSYLQSYPADTLKIDKDFINATKLANGQVIIDSVIKLARRLGLTVVAEGVEQSEQLEYLKTCGCNEVQGYLLCKPIGADQLEPFLRQFRLETVLKGGYGPKTPPPKKAEDRNQGFMSLREI